MDVICFTNPVADTKMEQAVIVNGLISKMWIERYAQGGEFKFVAPATSNMRNKLPIGSFVSHTDTTELMIVENHEISDQANQDSQLIITGRGFETFFENRIVGSNKAYPTSGDATDYVIPPDYIWNQAVSLIEDHILASNLLDDNNAIPFVQVLSQVTDTGDSFAISLKRGTLYERLLDILNAGGLGIKVIRPGTWSPLGAGTVDVAIAIHVGVDRTSSIIFSHDTGEIESAEYLWSNKKLKNAAVISGRWVETFVGTSDSGIARRVMPIDASDIDNQYSSAPTGTDLDAVVSAMQQRGIAALLAQNDIALTKAEVSKNTNKAAYRKDFDVGDIITINGDYNESSFMRISEYVEIEDEQGRSGYPSLTSV